MYLFSFAEKKPKGTGGTNGAAAARESPRAPKLNETYIKKNE